MGSVNDKLIYLDDTKRLIKEAIISKGVAVPSTATFREYIDYIKLIDSKEPFEWGDETAVGDSTWWNGLKKNIISMTAEQRASYLGKTKMISLSTPVLFSNQVLMRCVGYDLDGSKTLTFSAVNTLTGRIAFGSNDKWIGSTARAKCQEFYNACSAKDAILTVSKGTCPSRNVGRSASVTYNDETVFLMSERELGLDENSPISTANSTPDKAECTKGYNASYQYFTDNSKRVFKVGNANGSISGIVAQPWERSHTYGNSNAICCIGENGDALYDALNNNNGILPTFAIGE